MRDLCRLRLRHQQLVASTAGSPAEVVAALGALQAQDYLGTLWSRLDRVPFFLMLALIAAAAGAVIALLDRPLRRVLRD